VYSSDLGNRRKISLVVALLGAPPTMYLDEPSTGLDPVASRLMWRLLKMVGARHNHAVVLTTHNMLECEAVCTRIGIMKSGELVCMGNSQHLRSAFGTGYLLEIVLENEAFIDRAKEFISASFANAVIVDEHVNMINYEFPVESISRLSQAFAVMELNKGNLSIVDYSLSQSTLEQVFLKQIRPTGSDDESNINAEDKVEFLKPHFGDYLIGYIALLIAVLLPGFHHIVLRNYWRGVKYFFSWNEVMCGWVLDVFEMHVLVQRSVQEYGHLNILQLCICCCGGCNCCNRCCSCLFKSCQMCWFYMCCCCCCCKAPVWNSTPQQQRQSVDGTVGNNRGGRLSAMEEETSALNSIQRQPL